ncbi:hypothetical protein [Streptomyces sp. NBC_00847]|uniref:hypothetical protein n=1 Tax=Streptomyces sp. NBC_00847 TaxID=2975850 RepID=UPI0022505133|nr:hypothetical protein [Streptomyces sp. NBC_00847]MCX4881997.1 hypothetical protein [Streptomyces sp. NBC_00847]
MTNLSPRAWFAGCAIAASALLLTACTSGSGDGEAANTTSSQTAASASQAASKTQEKKLTDQAQAALAAVQGGTMVEAGAERVTDGIHTEPTLSQGKTYKLNLVCVGSGSAHLTFSPAITAPKTEVPCDQSVVQQRITAHKLPVRIDVEGTKGSTGVIAWQINSI